MYIELMSRAKMKNKKSTTLCLNMIVKNEAHIIKSTLENLCSYIKFDYWAICDTGSTDDTKDIINSFFGERKIPGELYEHKWKNFGFNRSEALRVAYNKTDYLLIFDADDKIYGHFKLPPNLEHDSYLLKFGSGFTYSRPLLINNRKKWEFVGVLHEYLSPKDDPKNKEKSKGQALINGNYYVDSGRSGNRSKNPNKYLDDAKILKEAYNEEINKNYSLACRYAFYCAQSYKDANMIDDSIEWYKKCLELNNWDQEKYYSALMLGDLYQRKDDMMESTKYWLETAKYDPERIEGIVNACDYYRNCGHNLLNILMS
jgi:tetratricopeptide (TPR) repeat protein